MDFNWDELQRNYKPMNTTYSGKKKPVKKSFVQDQISTGGGIGGSVAGGLAGAAAGSVLPGVGTVIGGLAGAILGGFGGGAAGQYIENGAVGEEDMSKNVLREGLTNGAFALGPIRGLNVAAQGSRALLTGGGRQGIKSAVEQAAVSTPVRNMIGGGIANKMAQSGTNLLGSQANLTRAQIRKLGPGGAPADVFGSINRSTGLSSLDNMANVGDNVTGSNGVLSRLTENSIGNSKGVDIGDLRTVADDLITNEAPLLTNSVRQNVLSQVQNSVGTAYGGSKGSLSTLGAPLDSFDVARSFEKMAAKIRSSPTPSAADEQLAGVYTKLAGTIKDRLYASPGVDDGIKLARTEAANSFRQLAKSTKNKAESKAYERLAAQTENMTDIGQIRKAQAPFVKLGKIDEATAAAQAGAGAQLGDQMQGLGKMLQKPLNLVAVPLDSQTPRVGGLMTKLGGKLSSVGGKEVSPISPLGVGTRMGVGGALTNGGTPELEMPNEQMLADSLAQEDTSLDQASVGGEEPQQTNPFGVSREQIAQNMMLALQNGDKEGFSRLKTMYELIGDYEDSGSGGGLSSTAATSLGMSDNGLNTLNQLERLYGNAGGGSGQFSGRIKSAMGKVGGDDATAGYERLSASSVSQLAKAINGGGQVSDADARVIIEGLPLITDSPELARIKFQALKERLAVARRNTMMYSSGGGSQEPSLADALMYQ